MNFPRSKTAGYQKVFDIIISVPRDAVLYRKFIMKTVKL